MGNKVLAFRKFISDDIDAYVSVVSEETKYSFSPTREIRYSTVELSISDGHKSVMFDYSIDSDSDKEYTEAMEQLEALRTAVVTTMDELVEAYSKLKFNALDQDESETD